MLTSPPAINELYWKASDGLSIRYAQFESKTDMRGTVLLLEGRREFIEKYGELIEEWRQRGFDVTIFDWRSQGASGRLVDNSHKSHVQSFEEYRDDVNRFYAEIVQPTQRGPLLVYAHSMGSCIALDWLQQNKPIVAGLILVAPMLVLPVPTWLNEATHMLAKGMNYFGHTDSYIPGEHDYKAYQHPFEQNVLTHDPTRYALITDWFAERPQLAVGGVTYGWLEAALSTIDKVRLRLAEIHFPTLVLHSGADRVLPMLELSRWTQKIPGAIHKTYPFARHDLMAEIDDIRNAAWQDIDAFVAKIFPT